MFHKIQILPASIQNPFFEIHPFTGEGGGQHILAGVPNSPPKILEQWLFTDNIMTFSYYITHLIIQTFSACLHSLVT